MSNQVTSILLRSAVSRSHSLAKNRHGLLRLSSTVAADATNLENSSLYFRQGQQMMMAHDDNNTVNNNPSRKISEIHGICNSNETTLASVVMDEEKVSLVADIHMSVSSETKKPKEVAEKTSVPEVFLRSDNIASRIDYHIKCQNYNEVSRLFDQFVIKEKVQLRPSFYKKLLANTCQVRDHELLPLAFQVWEELCNVVDDVNVEFHLKIIRKLGYSGRKQSAKNIKWMTSALLNKMQKLKDENDRQEFATTLFVSFSKWNAPILRAKIGFLMKFIGENNMNFAPQKSKIILENTPIQYSGQRIYTRKMFLNYLATTGYKSLKRSSFVAAVSMLDKVPRSDKGLLLSIVSSIVALMENSEENLHGLFSEEVLNNLSMIAAEDGIPDLMDFVSNLTDSMGCSIPKPLMYERKILSFLRSYRQDHLAFATLQEMERLELGVSPSFIEDVGKALCTTKGRVDNSFHLVLKGTEGSRASARSLNCIMAAYAQRNDSMNRVFSTFDEFGHLQLQPDLSTYTSLMKSLDNEISQHIPTPKLNDDGEVEIENPQVEETDSYTLNMFLDSADAVINMLEEANLSCTEQILHHHIRILCSAGKIDEAFRRLNTMLESDTSISVHTILNFTLHCEKLNVLDFAIKLGNSLKQDNYKDTPTYIYDYLSDLGVMKKERN